MLDLQFIRDNSDAVKEAVKNKQVDVNVDDLLKLDKQRAELQSNVDELRRQRNQLAGKGKNPSAEDIKRGKQLKEQIAKLEIELTKIETDFQAILDKIPNLYSPDTPLSKDASGNKVIRKWGQPAKFGFKPQPHWELGSKLGLIDSQKAAEVSGSRSAYLKGGLVELQFALIRWVLDVLTNGEELAKIIKQSKLGVAATPFTPMLVPILIRNEIFAKTGRLDPAEDKYFLKDDPLVLGGSAEHALAPYHLNEVLNGEQLPLRYLGYSTALRREAGSYGKDVRGLLRQHQFDKLEMESFSTPEQGEGEQRLMVAIQEHLMQQLELPYQVVSISTGDMGKPDYRQIDIETWMPAESKYRETQTSDYVTDFQARRLNIKYQEKDNKGFVHMNDATALAMGRTMIAIMENYQTQVGQIGVPTVLQPYMSGKKYL